MVHKGDYIFNIGSQVFVINLTLKFGERVLYEWPAYYFNNNNKGLTIIIVGGGG